MLNSPLLKISNDAMGMTLLPDASRAGSESASAGARSKRVIQVVSFNLNLCDRGSTDTWEREKN